MSNATFSRKPLVAAVLTTLAVFSAGAMAKPVNKDVTLIVGTGANTVPNTINLNSLEDFVTTYKTACLQFVPFHCAAGKTAV